MSRLCVVILYDKSLLWIMTILWGDWELLLGIFKACLGFFLFLCFVIVWNTDYFISDLVENGYFWLNLVLSFLNAMTWEYYCLLPFWWIPFVRWTGTLNTYPPVRVSKCLQLVVMAIMCMDVDFIYEINLGLYFSYKSLISNCFR